jgi:transmembrane sensor
MSDPRIEPHERGQLMQEAASWFARMRGPEAEDHRNAFEAWLRRGALHRQAYNRAAEIFAMGKYLRENENVQSDPAPTGRAGHRLLVPLAAIPLMAVAGWIMFGDEPSQRPRSVQIAEESVTPAPPGSRVATDPGESRSTRLADGSRIELSGGSLVEVRFDDRVRHLVLERGTARFAVAHDERPLIVEAGGGLIRAVGTLFEVAIGVEGEVSVYLIEGAVEVTSPATGGIAGTARRQLSAGEAMTYSARPEGRAPALGGRNSPGQPAAASPRALDYDNVTVAELIANANRSNSRPIRLADPMIGSLRVSGRFRIDDTGLLAERLAALFGLERTDGSDGQILLSRHQ